MIRRHRRLLRTIALVASGIVLITCVVLSHRLRVEADAAKRKKTAAGAVPRKVAAAPAAGRIK